MTRFPIDEAGGPPDPLTPTSDAIRQVLAEHGLILHLASDRQLDDDLLGNVGAYLWACQYGIGLLEDFAGSGSNNSNVIVELGSMTITGRRCAILRDKTALDLPTDLAGQIYKSVDLTNEKEVKEVVASWVSDDLSL